MIPAKFASWGKAHHRECDPSKGVLTVQTLGPISGLTPYC